MCRAAVILEFTTNLINETVIITQFMTNLRNLLALPLFVPLPFSFSFSFFFFSLSLFSPPPAQGDGNNNFITSAALSSSPPGHDNSLGIRLITFENIEGDSICVDYCFMFAFRESFEIVQVRYTLMISMSCRTSSKLIVSRSSNPIDVIEVTVIALIDGLAGILPAK